MADIFDNKQVFSLLRNKHIIFIGDSNIRAQYKDLLWLINTNTVIEPDFLKRKLEKSFLGDILLKRSQLHRGRDFEEVRSYEDTRHGIKIDFIFITLCYSQNIVDMFKDFKNKKNSPSIVFMNSCLWDLSRWGPDGANLYKANMKKLMNLFQECLPVSTLVIWSTALPIASQIRGGLLIKQIEFLKHTMRFDVMEANHFARSIVSSHGYDVLDTHHYMRCQVHRRANDGVHYLPVAVRYITNLMLTHVALSWGHQLPGRVKDIILEKIFSSECLKHPKISDTRLPLLENIAGSAYTGLKITFTNNNEAKPGEPKISRIVQEVNRVGPHRPEKRSRSNRNKPYRKRY